jgi:hypothetical protein
MNDQREDIAAIANCARFITSILVVGGLILFFSFVFSSLAGAAFFIIALIIAVAVGFVVMVINALKEAFEPKSHFDPPAFGWPRTFYLTDSEREYLGRLQQEPWGLLGFLFLILISPWIWTLIASLF